MTLQEHVVTLEEFDQFVNRPENADRLFELIAGRIVEVPSNPTVSRYATRIATRLQVFVDDNGERGYVTGEAGGYRVSGERYAPDVAYISKDRQPELATHGYNPTPPELAVEVVSPNDDERKLKVKIANYLAAGTVVWVAYPDTKEVEVYRPGKPVMMLGINDTLELHDILPGFELPIQYIFK